jgi:hypothetical protein
MMVVPVQELASLMVVVVVAQVPPVVMLLEILTAQVAMAAKVYLIAYLDQE